MYILAILLGIGYAVWNAFQTAESLKTKDPELEDVLKGMGWVKIVLVFVVLFVGATLFKCVMVVPAGHRVVVFDIFKGVMPKPLGEGLQVVIPMIQTPIEMDVRVQAVTYEASASSKDMQLANTKITLNFNPMVETIPRLYQQVGLGYAEKIIHPSVQEVVKAVTAKYTAEQLITQREKVRDEIHSGLDKILRTFNVQLVQTYITNFDFSESFNKAIEEKQVAEQDAQKSERKLRQVEIEAKQQIAKARAEAESLRMQNNVVTPMTLKLRTIEMQTKAVEKWDGHMPQMMMGNGAMPLIDLSNISKQKSEE